MNRKPTDAVQSAQDRLSLGEDDSAVIDDLASELQGMLDAGYEL